MREPICLSAAEIEAVAAIWSLVSISREAESSSEAVSYTHLTLPTNREE